MKVHLFVYGTLRRGLGPPKAGLLDGAQWLGEGSVVGRLLDLGAYPGLVRGRGRVRGEVYRLPRPTLQLQRLDAYEGCGQGGPKPDEYRRETVRVRMDDGAAVTAWAYVYTHSGPARRLASGDYARPRARRGRRR